MSYGDQSFGMPRMKIPRIVIVGANGFIGRYLVKAAEAAGIRHVIGLARPNFDLQRSETWHHFPRSVDCVVACCGAMDGTLEHLRAANAIAIRTLAQLSKDYGTKRFVLLSSGAVYGDTSEPTRPTFDACPTTDYGRTKLEGEEFAQAIWDQSKLSILRLYFPYGPGQHAPRLLPQIAYRIKAGEPIVFRGDGGPFLTVTHVEDLSTALVQRFILGDAPEAIANLASNRVLSIKEIAEQLASAIGVPLKFRPDGGGSDCLSEPYQDINWRPFTPRDVLRKE